MQPWHQTPLYKKYLEDGEAAIVHFLILNCLMTILDGKGLIDTNGDGIPDNVSDKYSPSLGQFGHSIF